MLAAVCVCLCVCVCVCVVRLRLGSSSHGLRLALQMPQYFYKPSINVYCIMHALPKIQLK